MALPAHLPITASEQLKLGQLAVAKRRAAGLLLAVTAVFLATSVAGDGTGWAGYLQATAEAAMVGGLADWFAVTALFRRPLGLPIPHTAIVVERKEQFGETLGEFIRDAFLTPDTIVERVRAAGIAARLGRWLSDPAAADRLAGHLADAAVAFADVLRDEDVHRAVEGVVREQLDDVPLAPAAGRALRFVMAGGRHEDALDAALRGLDRYLEERREDLRQRFLMESPWWLPGAVEDRIFERLLDGARRVLQEMVRDRDHELRRDLDTRLARLATELETSPALRKRGERLKADLLSQPELAGWVTSMWADAKVRLRGQAADERSQLRRQLSDAAVVLGARLGDDEQLRTGVERAMESAARYVAEHFSGEISGLVSGTIARWDAAETARRLELLLGPDLQYIRINGTVVGGGAGLVLHGVAHALP